MSSVSLNSIRRDNLPAHLSTFIGRKREITEIRELLSERRMLTLTGPGGCGKTRLALRVAGELPGFFRDGIWLTEFASLADEDLVSQAVASNLGVKEQSGRPLRESLVFHLHSLQALLMLDNCEHLVDACAQLSEFLLKNCPEIRILATSREPLGVPGEVVWSVPPLTLPGPQPWRSPTSEQKALAAYQQSEAIQLFISRAAEASPSFQLTSQNGPWVADICRRLDGIPLAIELAAARLHAFSVRQLAERLDDRFHLLTSRMHTGPERHKTLEAALDWSYALLSEVEQTVLRQLSIFTSGWTLEAAEAICAGEGIEQAEVMNVLSDLVDKSLVVAFSHTGGQRYRLLETIRQYGHQKLTAAGEESMASDRHLAYLVDWAEAAAVHLTGPNQAQWLDFFDVEHDNLRAALDWSQTTKERAKLGLRLVAACGLFWKLRGYLSEGRERLSTALKHSGGDRTEARAWALLMSANLAYLQSDYPATRALAEEGLAISRGLGPVGKLGVARGLDLIGELFTEIGEYESPPDLFEEALIIYRDLDEKRGIADMLMQLGWAAMRMGDYERANVRLNESLTLFREQGETSLLGLVLAGLGELAIRRRQLGQAVHFLEESLAIRRSLGERWGTGAALGSLGWVSLIQRDFNQMRERLGESLAVRIEIGDQGGIAWCLEKLAEAAVLQAQVLPSPYRRRSLQQAARIFGAAAALRLPIRSVIDLADQPDYDRLINDLQRTLGGKAFGVAWEEGHTLPLEEVVKLALTPALAPDDALTSVAKTEKVKFSGLSPREREAARLIAQGKSNQDIAEMMIVRVKTVETYVTRILNKLGFDSRVQVATWAIKVGLAESDSDRETYRKT